MDLIIPIIAVLAGLALLVWSAGRFVTAAAAVASKYSISPLLIGMVIIGFGTSAPEMMVSAFAAAEGNPGLALGNAYGSNIVNIAVILGITAAICPIAVQSGVVRKEIPILLGVTILTIALLYDGSLSRYDAIILLLAFCGLMIWSFIEAKNNKDDAFGSEVTETLESASTGPDRSLFWIIAGLAVLIASSRLLVWGAVEVATGLGISDLIIGLTIVAIGTSLPEFASSLSAALKRQPDLALGNILGSNLFNTLVVVGLAGVIKPLPVAPEIINRDLVSVGIVTIALFVFCYGFGGPGRINRVEGVLLILAYAGYTIWLII